MIENRGSGDRAHFRLYGYEKTTVSDLAKAIGFSKAYIYKFFESKQAIGEMICSSCLQQIQTEVNAAIHEVDSPPEKLRRMLKVLMEACLRLFFQDRKLYEIAASAASGRWPATLLYEGSSSRPFARSCSRAGRAATSSARRLWMKPPARST
ncbi:hypothetical protein PASLES2_20535 [Pseudomonas aeruginosa]